MGRLILYLLLIMVSLNIVTAVVQVDGDETIVSTHHDHPSLLQIDSDGEIIYYGFDFRPNIIEIEVPGAPGGPPDGSIVETPDSILIEEGIIPVVEKKTLLELLLNRLTITLGTGLGLTLLFLGTIGGVIDYKEITIDGKKLSYKEKVYYYLARPFRLIHDSEKAIDSKKRKEELKKNF